MIEIPIEIPVSGSPELGQRRSLQKKKKKKERNRETTGDDNDIFLQIYLYGRATSLV